MKTLVASALIVTLLGAPASASPPKGYSHREPPAHASRPNAPQTIASMTGWNLDVVDAVEIGGPWSVELSGNRAYVGYAGMLSVLDVATPSVPVRIGFTLLNGACDRIRTSGNYVFCAVQDYPAYFLQIIDVSNPTLPSVVQTISVADYAFDIEGNYLYMPNGDQVQIYDISAPASTALVGSFASYRVSDIVAEGGLIYVGRSTSPASGLQILDASNPTSPVTLSLLATGSGGYSLDVTGPYVYVFSFFSPTALYIVDASVPTAPTVAKVMPSFGSHELSIDGNHAYLLGPQQSSVGILDISDPVNPVSLPNFAPCSSYYTNTLDVAAGLAAIGADDGLCFVDVSNPMAPSSVSYYGSLPMTDNVEVAGNYLVLAANNGDLVTLNRQDTSLRYHADGAGWYIDAARLAVKDAYAYVSMCDSWGYYDDDGLEVFDISDPTSPTRVGLLNTTRCPRGVSLGASHAYLAPSSTFWVVDISDPNNPVKVGEAPIPARDQWASEPYVYCVSSSSQFKVVDVGIPSLPSQAASLSLPGTLENVAVSNSHAYVTSLDDLFVIDVSSPLAPALVGGLPLTSAHGIRIDEPYAYISDWTHVRIIDVSNPSDPSEVANIETGANGVNNRVAIAPPYVYAVSTGPLLILRTTLMTDVSKAPRSELTLQQNYPNPFNPSTTIAFEIATRGRVRLEVFDVRGQLVHKLIDESMPAGSHSITWDGRNAKGNVALSGVYFYRLEADGKSESKKMVILK